MRRHRAARGAAGTAPCAASSIGWDARDPPRLLRRGGRSRRPLAALRADPGGPAGRSGSVPKAASTRPSGQALLAVPQVTRIALGPRILRADTAAVAALALVQAVARRLAWLTRSAAALARAICLVATLWLWSAPFCRNALMARDVDRSDAHRLARRARRLAREGLQAAIAAFRIGTEHEKFPFRVGDHSPVAYEGPNGIRALLRGLQTMLGWEPITDEGRIIGMLDVTGGGAISLEPGGQFELSGAPLASIHAHLLGDQRASGPGPRDRRAARHPLPGPRHVAGLDPRRRRRSCPSSATRSWRATCQGRRDGPRHDVPHLDGAGEPRLRLRGRHGQEAARLAGAAADRHRHLRQLALHRTASRTAFCRCAPRSGATPTTTAPA